LIDSTDALIGQLATGQYSVASREQLIEAGVAPSLIDSRVKRGRLIPAYPGVYSLGRGIELKHSRWMAAVLACGEGSVLCRHSAADLWGFGTSKGQVHVLRGFNRVKLSEVPQPSARSGADRLAVHRTRHLPASDCTFVDDIPVTTVERTLLDLARVSGPGQLERWFDEAARLGLIDLRRLRAVSSAKPGWAGVGRLRELIESWDPTIASSRSRLELKFVQLCERASIPKPEVNSRLAGYEVDMVWRSRRVAVEVDSYRFHGDRQAFEKDRARDADLALAGFRVLRFTDRKILFEPEFVASRLRGALRLDESRV
jgi:hypothetical protein